jgi:hypothetical protein
MSPRADVNMENLITFDGAFNQIIRNVVSAPRSRLLADLGYAG